jgi:hypothetical protein
MREAFADLLAIDGVKGVLLFSPAGDLIFEEFTLNAAARPPLQDWRSLLDATAGFREADLLFEKGRIYMRDVGAGILMVATGLIAPSAMIRLNCDVLISSLKQLNAAKGRRRFFRR